MRKIEKLQTIAVVAEMSGPDWDEDKFCSFLEQVDPAFVASDAKGTTHAEWFHSVGDRNDPGNWSRKSWTIFLHDRAPHTPRGPRIAIGSFRGTPGAWYFIRALGGPLPPFISDAARLREERDGGGPL